MVSLFTTVLSVSMNNTSLHTDCRSIARMKASTPVTISSDVAMAVCVVSLMANRTSLVYTLQYSPTLFSVCRLVIIRGTAPPHLSALSLTAARIWNEHDSTLVTNVQNMFVNGPTNECKWSLGSGSSTRAALLVMWLKVSVLSGSGYQPVITYSRLRSWMPSGATVSLLLRTELIVLATMLPISLALGLGLGLGLGLETFTDSYPQSLKQFNEGFKIQFSHIRAARDVHAKRPLNGNRDIEMTEENM